MSDTSITVIYHTMSLTAGRGPIITIFFLFLSDYFYVVQYTPSNTS